MANFDNGFIQYSPKKEKEEKTFSALRLSVQIILYLLLIFFAIFFIWYTAFISTHKYYTVSGASMMSTLNSSLEPTDSSGIEDAVYVNTLRKIDVFDVIVAKRNVYDSKKKKWIEKNIVKRVMGLEGDYVSIAMSEDEKGEMKLFFYFIPKGTKLENFKDEDAKLYETMKENGYKIYDRDDWTKMNSDKDNPSRFVKEGEVDPTLYQNIVYEDDFFGTFLNGHLEEIETIRQKGSFDGTEKFFVSDSGMVYVRVPKGKYFCMGDNRGHSGDSRENGFYEVSKIVGEVEIVVYNQNFGKRLLKVCDYYFKQVQDFFAR